MTHLLKFILRFKYAIAPPQMKILLKQQPTGMYMQHRCWIIVSLFPRFWEPIHFKLLELYCTLYILDGMCEIDFAQRVVFGVK